MGTNINYYVRRYKEMTESDVVFDTDEFKNAYPQFANMSNQELENFF